MQCIENEWQKEIERKREGEVQERSEGERNKNIGLSVGCIYTWHREEKNERKRKRRQKVKERYKEII